MGSLGMQEIIIIFVLALIVFGPRKLPELGKTLGKGLAEFKRASNELKQTWEDEVRLDKEKEQIAEVLKDTTITKSDILGDDTGNSAGTATGSKEIQ
jgi:sec-independent protein translocase protein TatA